MIVYVWLTLLSLIIGGVLFLVLRKSRITLNGGVLNKKQEGAIIIEKEGNRLVIYEISNGKKSYYLNNGKIQ
ncbi:MAG: hypothetical protein CMC35_02870 [Flavobacteriaceae bacterium]|nr:hypothetical protein [Flavobacteriaceae bacterium]|tara:strand:+ start:717 stop:932 length:216 start_codon:yes stop_codon:yes gene_type:complete